MTKKEKNRKLIKQNTRNRLLNQKYITLIKKFSKLLKKKYSKLLLSEDINIKNDIKIEAFTLIRKLFSFIDKSVKKNIFHKNTAARKKSNIIKLFQKM